MFLMTAINKKLAFFFFLQNFVTSWNFYKSEEKKLTPPNTKYFFNLLPFPSKIFFSSKLICAFLFQFWNSWSSRPDRNRVPHRPQISEEPSSDEGEDISAVESFEATVQHRVQAHLQHGQQLRWKGSRSGKTILHFLWRRSI